MMQQNLKTETIQSAIELAKARWSLYNDFDLDLATWESLFEKYAVGDILQAIRGCAQTRDTRPEKRYQRFLEILERFNERGELHNQQRRDTATQSN